MVLTHKRSRRRSTGARYKKLYRGKWKCEMSRHPTNTVHSEKKILRTRRGRAGAKRDYLLSESHVNVMNPKTKK